ncbi:MAG: S1 RNA-binding domain-containing protein [Planctomycetota bacterium]
MAVDLEAIARRGRCEPSSLKLALPLIEQGYEPPFLARYRRDELGGLDESTLWALKASVEADQSLAEFREQLQETWKSTPLADPAIGDAIRKSGSSRTLQRLSKRLRQESSAGIATDTNRLVVRLLNPHKGDPADPKALADSIEEVSDSQAAVDGLASTLPVRLAGDPRVISAAVRWLSRNAKIHISNVHDPHTGAEAEDQSPSPKTESPKTESPKEAASSEQPAAVDQGSTGASADEVPAEIAQPREENTGGEPPVDQPSIEAHSVEQATSEPSASTETQAPGEDVSGTLQPVATTDSPSEPSNESAVANTAESQAPSAEGAAPASPESSAAADAVKEELPGFSPDPEPKPEAKAKPAPKKSKKISPRQRRRRWLVSVLKPLEGKRMPATKLSAFQVVMLGRALRSQVAVCAFEYDAAKLVGEIKRTITGLNKNIESMLGDLVMKHEADIREAAETAWWDELHERASARLVTVVADHLRKHVNRGALDAKVVMSIDAVGPKTAATSIVSADGRVLHGEDIPCQLTGNVRSQTVAKMGELIHKFHVDLVVISNGPARRACLIALGDLIGQSPEGTLRWTIAERSGADSYSSSNVANAEMRSTPRRFRAAAWIAFSVLHPSQAYAKVDPLRLRLASFQSELSDDALSIALGHIMSSGASRGGVDANAAPGEWLEQLPGMSPDVAKQLTARRESNLLKSRKELSELPWNSAVHSRQAFPFLRVFESDEVLDGTLIHPDDYALAKKLATALEIELPPSAPNGYESPNYAEKPEAEPKLVDATEPAAPAPVEDFDNAGEQASEFTLEDGTSPSSESDGENSVAVDQTSQSASEGDVTPPEADSANAEASSVEETSTESQSEDQTHASTDGDASPEPAAQEPAADETADGANKPNDAENVPPIEAAEAPQTPEPVKRPRPERAKIDKCIKEWQIGRHRTNQLVSWLCDPFGETATSGAPPAVLKTMPTLKSLQQGEQVIGVVVGVMSFGVFVEIAPDCSGLIHVSRLSDGYVEDLNETVQVGDVVTAWVTGIDEKRRRVGLSTLSPEQEKKLESERQSRPQGRQRGGQPRRDSRGGGKPRGGQRDAAASSGPGAGRGKGGGNRENARGGGKKQQSGGRQQGRGGGGGRGRQGDRGPRKSRKPESYRVVAKAESKPISDAMKKGDEPLRSFGDLMQFYTKPETSKAPETSQTPKVTEQEKPVAAESQPQAASDPATTPELSSSNTDANDAAAVKSSGQLESASSPESAGGDGQAPESANPAGASE